MDKFLKFLILFFITLLFILILLFFNGYFVKKIYPLKYKNIVEKYSKEYSVRESLVFSVIKVESNFDEFAQSSAGAIGLMQITEETFNWLKNKNKKITKENSERLFDVETNIKFGIYFLNLLLSKYSDENVALCAYNAGTGNVDNWLKNKEYSKDGKTLTKIPFKETEEYIKKIIKSEKIYVDLYFKK